MGQWSGRSNREGVTHGEDHDPVCEPCKVFHGSALLHRIFSLDEDLDQFLVDDLELFELHRVDALVADEFVREEAVERSEQDDEEDDEGHLATASTPSRTGRTRVRREMGQPDLSCTSTIHRGRRKVVRVVSGE